MPKKGLIFVLISHTPPYFGLAFSYFIAKNVKAELDWRYVLNSKIILSDPSDDDTVEIDTSRQYFASLNVVYQCLQCKFRPYVLMKSDVSLIHSVSRIGQSSLFKRRL